LPKVYTGSNIWTFPLTVTAPNHNYGID